MRRLLAFLALIGLLLSPASASAAAASCLHHEGDGQMIMAMDAAPPVIADAEHGCCDEPEPPVRHDEEACAQACAAMCGVSAAMPDAPGGQTVAVGLAALKAAAPYALHGQAPPGLDHPPKLDI